MFQANITQKKAGVGYKYPRKQKVRQIEIKTKTNKQTKKNLTKTDKLNISQFCGFLPVHKHNFIKLLSLCINHFYFFPFQLL